MNNRAWTLLIDDHRIAWLTFDQPGSKVNTLSSATLGELEGVLDEIARTPDLAALVICTGKKDSFIVGADLEELGRVTDEATARGLAETGQRIFGKVAALPIPTIAVIHGACMGGGLELSLACDYRLATEHEKASMGLPEVNLGILPGWGGTQRLPRVVGLIPSLDMILAGKVVSARKAARLGLVDGRVAAAFMPGQVTAFVGRVSSPKGARAILAKRRRAQGRIARLMAFLPPLRGVVFSKARKQILSRTHGHYPAPLEALRVIQETHGKPVDRGLPIEAEALGRLANTSISRNLVRLFRLSQDMKRSGGGVGGAAPARNTGVVGAGAMGGGIAWALSNCRIDVRMKDISWDAIAAGMGAASKMYDALVVRRKMTPGAKNLAMHRISGCVEYTGFGRLDAVVEAVVEDMGVKKKVLREIEEHVSDDCLICTNTSSLPIDEMAAAMRRPERFIGLHFFNPVNRMQLVEVIACKQSSPEAVARGAALVRQMGKLPLIVGACPGFLVNRILLPYIVEAARMFEEGVGVERIDGALERFGMPMGPLTLADEVGLDVGVKVAKVLEEAYGARMHVPPGLARVADEGLKGKKSGKGFYVYQAKHKKHPNADARRIALNGHANDAAAQMSDEDIVDRAVLSMVNEAARCLDEGVAARTEDVDAAMVLGTGFAPFRGGLLRYADERGMKGIVDRLHELETRFGDRFTPAPLLEKVASNGGNLLKHMQERESTR